MGGGSKVQSWESSTHTDYATPRNQPLRVDGSTSAKTITMSSENACTPGIGSEDVDDMLCVCVCDVCVLCVVVRVVCAVVCVVRVERVCIRARCQMRF